MLTTLNWWTFVTRPATLAALAATLLLAWPISRRFAHRFRCARAVALAFVVAVGVILALTMTPNVSPTGLYPGLPPHFLSLLKHDPAALGAQLVALPRDAEQLANIALYVPVGLLGAFALGSAVRAALFGTALTIAVETCQYGIIGRAGTLTDIRNNTAGAVLGALLAVAARHITNRTARAPELSEHR